MRAKSRLLRWLTAIAVLMVTAFACMAAQARSVQIVTSWDRLRQVLLKAIDRQRYHFGYVFERVEHDGGGVHVYFANGRTERADLLVGCDGFRSSVRSHLAPEVQPIYSGYYIWRGAPLQGHDGDHEETGCPAATAEKSS